MKAPRIRRISGLVLAAAGADYHSQVAGHWIAGRIATPMSRYPEFRETRTSWGIDVLGTLVVQIEDDEGRTGVGVTVGGPPAAWIVEHHLARFVEGRTVRDLATIWDQMWRSTLYYGRKGLAVNALSAVDLALWDLLGRTDGSRVCDLIGGNSSSSLDFYATGPDPERAREIGFLGAKVVLHTSPWEGRGAMKREIAELGELRDRIRGFPLRLDCWMSLDLESATWLMEELVNLGFLWIEEPFPPEQYWAYAELRRRANGRIQIATGEHEAGLDGFRTLLDAAGADVIQPDVGWCGGLSELLRIDALAADRGVAVIPHGSSVYGYDFMHARGRGDPAEFLMMHPAGTEVVPMFQPLFRNEPVPETGRIQRSNEPGFGVQLDPELVLHRPFPRNVAMRS